jgi:hypothetical protein
MADAPERRINLQTEEVASRAGVSEATATRIAQSVNFVNKRQYDSRGFFLNGPYASQGAQAGVDGAWAVLFDVDIVGVMMFNLVAGTSGTTRLDIRRFTAPNTPSNGATIFTTRPAITTAAGSNAYLFRDVLNSETIIGGSGLTQPVMSITELNRGDMLTLNLDNAQVGGQNCGVILYYRPR